MSVDSIDELRHPGTLFAWGDSEFMTDGIRGDALNVVRLKNYGDRDQLQIDELKDGIEDDEVSLLKTTAL